MSPTRLTDDAQVDAAIAKLTTSVTERPPLIDRVVGFASELTSTRRRQTACAIWLGALAIAIWAALPTNHDMRTALGPAHVACGLDSFVGGGRDPAVRSACHTSEGLRLGLFVPVAIVVVAGIVAAGLIFVQRAQQTDDSHMAVIVDRLRQSPVQAALVALGLVALPVAAFAARPVSVERLSVGGVITAHCGADTYLFGYPDRAIDQACSHAYSGQAHVLAGALILLAVGVGAALHLAFAGRQVSPLRLGLAVVGIAAAATALVALRPVDVLVREGGAPVVARCGVDTYVVGHPDRAVQSACRHHVGKEAGVALAATALALVTLMVSRVDLPRRRAHAGTQRSADPAAAMGTRPT